MKKRSRKLGIFTSCARVVPAGFEKHSFPAGKNPNVCILRLNAEVAKYYRKPGDCVQLVNEKGKVVARQCPPQRRKGAYKSGIYEGTIRAIEKRKR